MQFRKMQENDFDEILALMTAGFTHSTLYTWAAPDMTERLSFLEAMFRRRIRSWLDSAFEVELAVTDDGRIAASATWEPPKGNGTAPKLNETARSANPLDEVFAGRSPELVKKWSKFQPIIESQHHSLSGSFWSLAPIVVAPAEKGKGIASLLIRKKLAEIDAAVLPCFLATQDKVNLLIYERFGFTKIEEIFIDEGILSYSMVRKANAPLNL
jgi:ribosomal protein S18 acetylase RimI-like enzyme